MSEETQNAEITITIDGDHMGVCRRCRMPRIGVPADLAKDDSNERLEFLTAAALTGLLTGFNGMRSVGWFAKMAVAAARAAEAELDRSPPIDPDYLDPDDGGANA